MDPAAILERLIELTELEAPLIAGRDAAALTAVHDERAALLTALPDRLAPACEPLVRRFQALAAANERAAEVVADELRRELSSLGDGRTAIGAYAVAAPLVSMDREG